MSKLNKYIWKGQKTLHNGIYEQEEIDLLTAPKDVLERCYNQCQTMLYNDDFYKPGRVVLKDIVIDQIKKCNVTLYIREKRKESSMMDIISALRSYPYDMKLKDFIQVDEVYEDLTVSDVIDGALNKLGIFVKRHITLASLFTRKGVKLTKEEYDSLQSTDQKYAEKYIRERLFVPDNIKIKLSKNGLLCDEIQEIISIRKNTYDALNTTQLILLRDKVLPDLLNDINKHINFWEIASEVIQNIRKDKGYIQ